LTDAPDPRIDFDPMNALGCCFLCALLSGAPLQCSRSPDPELETYETPPESLYALAERFRTHGEEQARRETLEYLVARYPNSRFALRAKDELGPTAAKTTSSRDP